VTGGASTNPSMRVREWLMPLPSCAVSVVTLPSETP
jgi:hypothetical protein